MFEFFQNYKIHWVTIFDVLASISVIFASIVAAMGFGQWRFELIEKRRIEIAEEVIDIFSRMPEVFKIIRLPLILGNEGSSFAKQKEKPTFGDVTFERMEKYKDYFSSVQSIKYRFIAYFGQENKKPFDIFDNVLHKLRHAAYILSVDNNSDEEKIDSYKAIIWSGYQSEDEIAKKIENARKLAYNICEPVLNSRRRLFGIF